MSRILDVNYKEYESIPFWKDIVAKTIMEHFIDIEGEHYIPVTLRITTIGQLVGKRFRVEIQPEKTFDKQALGEAVKIALREYEVEIIAAKQIAESTEFLVSSLRDEKIQELVTREHNDIRLSLEANFEDERESLISKITETDNALTSIISNKFDSYDAVLTKERSDFEATIKDVDKKLEGYDALKKESISIVENHKNFDGIALGVAAASMLTSLMIILFLLLA